MDTCERLNDKEIQEKYLENPMFRSRLDALLNKSSKKLKEGVVFSDDDEMVEENQ